MFVFVVVRMFCGLCMVSYGSVVTVIFVCGLCFTFTACILDIIRCTCVYKTPQDLISGVERVIDQIKKGDTPLKRVLRIKNLFYVNKQKAQAKADQENRQLSKGDYLYQYADIKLNVAMDWNGMSIILELQFLLQFILNQVKIACLTNVNKRVVESILQISVVFGAFLIDITVALLRIRKKKDINC